MLVHKGLAHAKWQFVYHGPFERLRDVEVRVAVVRGRIVPELPNLSPGGATPSGRVLIIQHMRPGIVDVEAQPVARTLPHVELQRIVVGDAVEVRAGKASKRRIWARTSAG